MTQFKKGYYQADCQNGVTYLGSVLEDSSVHVSDPGFFLHTIPYIDHDESLTTFLDESNEDIFDTINETYGVK